MTYNQWRKLVHKELRENTNFLDYEGTSRNPLYTYFDTFRNIESYITKHYDKFAEESFRLTWKRYKVILK